jgi:hypothetical protein
VQQEGDYAKDVFWIRLDKKTTREGLAAICRDLKTKSSRPRTVVWFVLGDLTPRPGAWATADCDPEPKVDILGLTPEQEADLLTRSLPAGASEILGRWLEDDGGDTALFTIYRASDSLWLETARARDGRGIQQELVTPEAGDSKRFQRKEVSRAGDHYVINGRGDLELRDDKGLIGVARRVR